MRLLLAAIAAVVLLACVARGQSIEDQPIVPPEATPITTGEVAQSPAGPSFSRVAVSLAVVTGLILALAWGYNRLTPGGIATQTGPVQLVSRTSVTPKHQVLLLKVGHRILVVGDSGQGMQALSSVERPEEVTAILAAAGKSEAGHDLISSDAFAASLASAEDEYEALPGADAIPADLVEQLGAADADVKQLIERVRGLSTGSGPAGVASVA